MLFLDIVFIFILAVLVSTVTAHGLGWRHPRSGNALRAVLFIFAILFFGLWAAGSWLPAWGPVMGTTPWLSFTLIALLFVLLLLAVAPPQPSADSKQTISREERSVGIIFGLFFWILIPVLLVIALIAYV